MRLRLRPMVAIVKADFLIRFRRLSTLIVFLLLSSSARDAGDVKATRASGNAIKATATSAGCRGPFLRDLGRHIFYGAATPAVTLAYMPQAGSPSWP